MKTILITIVIVGLLCGALARAQGCAAPGVSTKADKDSAATVADFKTITLKITGMSCEQCVGSVRRALQGVEGVQRAEVSLERAQTVVTSASDKVKPEQLIAAVQKAGGDRHAFKAEAAGAFMCTSCGKAYDHPGRCCGQPTRKAEGGS